MNQTLETITVPLTDDGRGGFRVGRTRVSFESVWNLYQQGESPTTIVQAFDVLELADVYAVIAWALQHPIDVDAYMARREAEALAIRRQAVAAGITPPAEALAKRLQELKERLSAIRGARENDAPLPNG